MSLFARLSLARFKRIEDYISNLEEKIELKNVQDKEIIHEINDLIRLRIKDLKRSRTISFVFLVGIYFSFVSIFFSDLFLLGLITETIGEIVGFFGTTVFVIGLFITNRFRELYYQDLTLLTSHLISLYSKIGYVDDKMIFDESNMYRTFLSFFKKRGF